MMELFDPAFIGSLPRFVTPLLLAALGGALCERAGVFNIGLEGFVLVGAFCAVIGSFMAGSAVVGVIAACFGGMIFGAIFALTSVRFGADAIVTSIGLNLLAVGLTVFLLRTLLGATGAFTDPGIVSIATISLPVIADTPAIGALFRDQSVLFPLALILAVALHFFFARHTLGLAMRAAGEAPEVLSTGGRSLAVTRSIALIGCGVLCGLAGAQLSISNVGLFVENMSAGRGWIAVVAVLMTRGRPLPLLAVIIIFSLVDSLSFRLQAANLPQQATEALPYLAALAAMVVAAHQRRFTFFRGSRT